MNPSGTVNLRYIVRPELEAVGAENGRNFTVEGPVVPLPSREAQTMAMTIHELTTNAAKISFPHMLGGTAELNFTPNGVACRLEFPLFARARESHDG